MNVKSFIYDISQGQMWLEVPLQISQDQEAAQSFADHAMNHIAARSNVLEARIYDRPVLDQPQHVESGKHVSVEGFVFYLHSITDRGDQTAIRAAQDILADEVEDFRSEPDLDAVLTDSDVRRLGLSFNS